MMFHGLGMFGAMSSFQSSRLPVLQGAPNPEAPKSLQQRKATQQSAGPGKNQIDP